MRTIFRNAVLASAAVLLGAGATAQASPTDIVKANIPFSFVVNGKTFPAGKYDIERVDLAQDVLLIRSENGKNHTMVPANPEHRDDKTSSHPTLTFKRDENHYKLSVVRDSDGEGWELLR